MNPEKDKLLEEHLRSLRPAPPGTQLEFRIEGALARIARRRKWARLRAGAGWASMAVAASVLITFGVMLFNGRLTIGGQAVSGTPAGTPAQAAAQPASGNGAFQPVLAENNLRGRIDDGIVFLQTGLMARRYRYEFVDRVVWQNPANGALVEMEIPREEVVLVPVQTF